METSRLGAVGVCKGALVFLVLLAICGQTSAFHCYQCSLAETMSRQLNLQRCVDDIADIEVTTCAAGIDKCIRAEHKNSEGKRTVWLRGCALRDAKLGCEVQYHGDLSNENCVCNTELCNTAHGNYPGVVLIIVSLCVVIYKILIKE